jgi:hypothetical protein
MHPALHPHQLTHPYNPVCRILAPIFRITHHSSLFFPIRPPFVPKRHTRHIAHQFCHLHQATPTHAGHFPEKHSFRLELFTYEKRKTNQPLDFQPDLKV